ncbi:hypothetical protein SAMN04487777_1385 [Priestia aryabhattai B8W22]|nr:hypothetical protein SAMN04487777_1385 [Priestia aryabhattai B8W22]
MVTNVVYLSYTPQKQKKPISSQSKEVGFFCSIAIAKGFS